MSERVLSAFALGLLATALAPCAAEAKGYKNCRMDTRFRPPMRTCDDPTPYKKPKPVKDKVLEPIRSSGPSPFSTR